MPGAEDIDEQPRHAQEQQAEAQRVGPGHLCRRISHALRGIRLFHPDIFSHQGKRRQPQAYHRHENYHVYRKDNIAGRERNFIHAPDNENKGAERRHIQKKTDAVGNAVFYEPGEHGFVDADQAIGAVAAAVIG